MNKNRQNRYARAETASTPSPFPKTIPIGGIDMPYTASIRRKVRKLVQSGKVDREELPLSHTVNNATFNWLKPLASNDIRGNYTGEPFNVGAFAPVATAPVIAPTIEKVEAVIENTTARKVAKRKTTPKVEATVTKVAKVTKEEKPVKASKTTKPKTTKSSKATKVV